MAQDPNESKAAENDASIPKKMKAVRLQEYNNDMTKAFKIEEIDVPVPGEGEVLVKVYFVALNPVDWKIAMGYLASIFKQKLPQVIGYDFAGTIAGLGSGVAKSNPDHKIGSRVAGMIDLLCDNGVFAEYMVCPVKNAGLLPDSISTDLGAAIPLVSLTSYEALVTNTKIKETKGLKVLILGGSTSTGMAAIQICKYFGASVIATTSSSVDLCTKLGATQVYNYKDKDAATWYDDCKGKEFDIIYDCVGPMGTNETWKYAQSVLKSSGGNFITIAGDFEKPKLEEDKDGVKENEKNTYKYFIISTTTYLDDVFKLVTEGALDVKIDVDSPYTLDTMFDMFNKSMGQKAKGKLVMRICEDKK